MSSSNSSSGNRRDLSHQEKTSKSTPTRDKRKKTDKEESELPPPKKQSVTHEESIDYVELIKKVLETEGKPLTLLDIAHKSVKMGLLTTSDNTRVSDIQINMLEAFSVEKSKKGTSFELTFLANNFVSMSSWKNVPDESMIISDVPNDNSPAITPTRSRRKQSEGSQEKQEKPSSIGKGKRKKAEPVQKSKTSVQNTENSMINGDSNDEIEEVNTSGNFVKINSELSASVELKMKMMQEEHQKTVIEFDKMKNSLSSQIENLEKEVKSMKQLNAGKKSPESPSIATLKDLQEEVVDLKKLFVQENSATSRKIAGTDSMITNLSNEVYSLRQYVESLDKKIKGYYDCLNLHPTEISFHLLNLDRRKTRMLNSDWPVTNPPIRMLEELISLGKLSLGSPKNWRFYLFIIIILLSIAELFLYNSVGEISSKFMGVFIDGPKNNFEISPLYNVLWISLSLIFLSTIFKTGKEFTEESLVNTWRRKLTHIFQSSYFSEHNYYKLIFGKQIDNTDQRITRDIEIWTKLIGSILSKIIVSPLTILYYTITTLRSLGWQGPVFCYCFFIIGTIINRFLMDTVLPYWYQQEIYEGNFRFSHMTIRANAESIAFYSGQEWELQDNTNQLNQVTSNRWNIIKRNSILRFHMNLFGYLGAFFNYFILAFSIYVLKTFRGGNMTPGEYASAILYSSFQCLALIYGFTQFIQLGSDVGELGGHTQRLSEMLKAMKPHRMNPEEISQVKICDFVGMENVSIQTPENTLIVENLTFKVSQNDNLLITGVSGAGKSSILRVLNGIWNGHGGIISKPSDIYFVPQQTYTKTGTLLEQITYPNFEVLTSSQLLELLKVVKLDYLFNKAAHVMNWDQLLSPGEKQRLALARLFYKNPKFAVLDESTSSIDVDVEEEMYMECFQREITVISVGHRPTLNKYHKRVLTIFGDGKWEIKTL